LLIRVGLFFRQMKDEKLKRFSREIMDLYLKQHFLLREKIQTTDNRKEKLIQDKILAIFSKLHQKMLVQDPHVRVIVGLGGNFKEGRETYLMKYSTFCRRKEIFEFPNNLVSFIPPNFDSFLEFAKYANTSRNNF
jgi:hypothetical protein